MATRVLALLATHCLLTCALSDPPLDVSWSPMDSPERLLREIAMGETVRQSRVHFKDDAADDWVIRYAVYGLSETPYVPPLLRAFKNGVRVQVLLEHRQLLHPWVKLWEDFKEAGMAVAHKNFTQKNLTDSERRSLNFVPIDIGGLFHLKVRYFRWRDISTGERRELLFTGSFNPENTAFKFNVETLLAIADKQLIKDYLSIVDAALFDQTYQNVWRADQAFNVLYSKSPAPLPQPKGALTSRAKLEELIEAEQESILLPVFALRNLHMPGGGFLKDKLCAAKKRGVFIAIMSNHDMIDKAPKEGGDPSLFLWHLWDECKIPAYKTRIFNPFSGLHEKNAIFGITEPKIVTDTTNWSGAGFGNKYVAVPANAETMLVLRPRLLGDKVTASTLALRFVSNFFYIARRFAHEQACPFMDVNLTNGEPIKVYDNCATNELPGQPDWDFVPTPDEMLAQLAASVTHAAQNATAWPQVSWYVEARMPTSGARPTGVKCNLAGTNDSFSLTLRPAESGAMVSDARQVPFLQRLLCTLTGEAGHHLHDFSHVADPAMHWAEDGLTLRKRATDDELFEMLSSAVVDVPQVSLSVIV